MVTNADTGREPKLELRDLRSKEVDLGTIIGSPLNLRRWARLVLAVSTGGWAFSIDDAILENGTCGAENTVGAANTSLEVAIE